MIHKFGEYVLAIVPSDSRPDDLAPRAEEAVVLSRPPRGITTYIVYLLDSKSVVRRRGLKPAKLTDAALSLPELVLSVQLILALTTASSPAMYLL